MKLDERCLIKKSILSGQIVVPSSKSHTLRAILFATLANGKSFIHQYLSSKDTDAMIGACRLFGAIIKVSEELLEIDGINGSLEFLENVIDAGNSGIVLRFCSAVGALAKHPVVITGDHSIRHQRPMKELLKGLSQLGVFTTTMRGDGYAPVILQGPITSGSASIVGEDSQPVSALLIGAAFSRGPIELVVENPGEKPWIDMTLSWFDKLGIVYENREYRQYYLKGGSRYSGFSYEVPGDFSSAAFPVAAALITRSELTLTNIDMTDTQGDKLLIGVFQRMGALIQVDPFNKKIYVKKSGPLVGLSVDINDFVDAITILAVVACFAEGETCIYNGVIAKQKECNRIRCISQELSKMGADIQETEDGLLIRKSKLKGALVDSHQDHRMAMSLAVAALGAEGDTTISSIECVGKTFPDFFEQMRSLGAKMELQ